MSESYGGRDELSKKNRKAYAEGTKAWLNNLKEDTNPYPKENEEHRAWIQGYKYGNK